MMHRIIFAMTAIALSASMQAADVNPELSLVKFQLTDGWVDFRIERDNKPVADAKVTVLVGAEVWATGETGMTGEGTFPQPANRKDCQVVIDLGAGPSSPIPLEFLNDKTLSPTQAPVLDGTAECCQVPRRPISIETKSAARPSDPYFRDRLIIAGGMFAVICAWLGIAWRKSRRV